MFLFDFCLVTASSARQAEDFRRLIQKRLDAELYPREIAFRVYADPPGGRVGSGGGTLWALRSLIEEERAADAGRFLESHRILVIHAGGESRRLPCFAPEGKLFSPVPVESSSLLPPVAFDLQLPLFLKFPWRRGEVLVASGDVVLDFDPALDADRGDICGFAKPAPPEQGARHGVFKFDRRLEHVEDFLQKAPVDYLREHALLEGTGDCALDVGLVALSPAAAQALLSFGAALRFDLYSEVLTAALKGLSFDDYLQRIGRSPLPQVAARRLYELLSPFRLGAVLIRSSRFVHLGTLPEFVAAGRDLAERGLRPFYEQDPGELRPFTSSEKIVYNSLDVQVTVRPSSFVLVEGCRALRIREAQGDNLFVGLEDFDLDLAVPPGFCLEQRRRGADPAVLVVYGNVDTFRKDSEPAAVIFCGQPLTTWLAQRGLTLADVHGSSPVDPLELQMYCADVPPAFAAGYWSVPDRSWIDRFRASRRVSLKQLNEDDDVVARDERRAAVRSRMLGQAILSQQGWKTISAVDFRRAFSDPRHRPALQALLARTDDDLLRLYRHALLAELTHDGAAAPLRIDFLERPQTAPLVPHLKLDQIVWARCPVRLDLAGGWTDTPPYTLRYGGQVVNVAVDLNGQPPIQVFCRRTEEHHVRIHSVDLGLTETITDFRALADYGDPGAAFALPKAALTLLGLGASHGAASLSHTLAGMGGGLELTLLCAVPKGSGLGTSSILGAAIVAALHRFFGRPTLHADLSRQVLQIEQMLTTGGGWQDQLGGMVGGAKYIESRPGSRPSPLVYQLDPALFQDRATAPCFTLFYTGLTRLAKNILVDVVRRVNGGSRAYLFTLRYMRQLAVAARDAIALRRLDEVAAVVAQSWEANKRIHPSTTNEEVEALLARTAPYYAGAKLLGAGGGGYALFVSSNAASAEKLRELLQKEFENDRARLVDMTLDPGGLAVSVS
jgi:galactokinase/mevalonate kinase-like predicted kinase